MIGVSQVSARPPIASLRRSRYAGYILTFRWWMAPITWRAHRPPSLLEGEVGRVDGLLHFISLDGGAEKQVRLFCEGGGFCSPPSTRVLSVGIQWRESTAHNRFQEVSRAASMEHGAMRQ